jgi:cell shape-determining protein MreC
MKRQRYIIVAIVVVGLILAWQLASRSVAQSSTNADDPTQSMRDQYQARAARYEAMLKTQEDGMKRHDELESRIERLQTRMEQSQERFEKILGTWERQQKQYQAYLDSLEKK